MELKLYGKDEIKEKYSSPKDFTDSFGAIQCIQQLKNIKGMQKNLYSQKIELSSKFKLCQQLDKKEFYIKKMIQRWKYSFQTLPRCFVIQVRKPFDSEGTLHRLHRQAYERKNEGLLFSKWTKWLSYFSTSISALKTTCVELSRLAPLIKM